VWCAGVCVRAAGATFHNTMTRISPSSFAVRSVCAYMVMIEGRYIWCVFQVRCACKDLHATLQRVSILNTACIGRGGRQAPSLPFTTRAARSGAQVQQVQGAGAVRTRALRETQNRGGEKVWCLGAPRCWQARSGSVTEEATDLSAHHPSTGGMV